MSVPYAYLKYSCKIKMWNAQIYLQKIYRAAGSGTDGSGHPNETEIASILAEQPTPGAQSVEDLINDAGPNTLASVVGYAMDDPRLDDPREVARMTLRNKRKGPLENSFSKDGDEAGSSSAVGSSAVGSSAAGSSAAGSSAAGSHTVPPNIVGSSIYNFGNIEFNSKLKKDDSELLKDYLKEYFKHLRNTIKSRAHIVEEIIKRLGKPRVHELFKKHNLPSSVNAAAYGDIAAFDHFIKVLDTIIKE
jgi:hypothetical protein